MNAPLERPDATHTPTIGRPRRASTVNALSVRPGVTRAPAVSRKATSVNVQPLAANRRNALRLKPALALLLCAVALCACSSNVFIYNRLETLVTWYVDGYVDLTRPQKKSFREQLRPVLHWHRGQELHFYLAFVDRIEGDLRGPVAADSVQGWTDEAIRAGERLERRLLPLAFGLGRELDNRQMRTFVDSLLDKQAELEREYLDRDEKMYRQQTYQNLVSGTRQFLGRLQPEQKQRLREASQALLRYDNAWLEERRDWLEQLRQILLDRDPGWEDAITAALTTRRGTPNAARQSAYLHNQSIINSAIADVLNTRTAKQSARIAKELGALRRDLQKLIEQGSSK